MKWNNTKTAITFILLVFFLLLYHYFQERAHIQTSPYAQVDIPKTIVSTYHTKNKIPEKVFNNIKQYAPNYQLRIFDDNDIIAFLKKYYPPAVLTTFKQLKGAHKADLFRYCYLYKFGGIYIDIKTELIQNIDDVLNYKDIDLFTVLSIRKGTVYQGIIASKPNNALFKQLIDYMIKTQKPVTPERYQEFTADFYHVLQDICQKRELTSGYNKATSGQNIYLFQEKCTRNASDCKDGLDRYKVCCYVYNSDDKVIKTRYADYPWI